MEIKKIQKRDINLLFLSIGVGGKGDNGKEGEKERDQGEYVSATHDWDLGKVVLIQEGLR